jgi:hypothetical protein
MTTIVKCLIILGLLQVFMISCKSPKDTSRKSFSLSSSMENFDTFYDKFHSDSIFQRSRIKHPLEGYSNDSGEQTNWSKENFGLLKTRIYDVDTTEYKVYYNKTHNEFTQKFWIENSGFWSEYTFKLINKKWYLVSAFEYNL